jgi:hypothetical protein
MLLVGLAYTNRIGEDKMKKIMLLLSFMCLCLLMVGTTMKLDNIFFWLASDSMLYQCIRLALAVVVLALLFTNPPRRIWLQLVTGLFAIGVGGWVVQSTIVYSMHISDAICFLATSITIAVALLERGTVSRPAYRGSFERRNSFSPAK